MNYGRLMSKTLLTEDTEGTEDTEDLGFGKSLARDPPPDLPGFFRDLRYLRVLRA
jgi:hypothetical protein